MRTRFMLSLLFVFALIFSVTPVFAGSISVTDFNDAGLNCTLREAIAEANAVGAGGGTLGNGCSGATAGSNTINLPAGTYTVGSQLPNVTTTIIIQPGGAVTVQANASPNTATYRVFRATSATGNLTLNDMTVRHGGNSGVFIDGGCVRADTSGTLTLDNVIVEYCYGRFGGGVSVLLGTLTVTGGSIIRFNEVSRDGGGIDTQSTAVTVTGSTISDNLNANPANNGAGGGLSAFSPTSFSMSGTTISNNSVGSATGGVGGGVYFSSFSGITGSITGSVFTGNSSSGAGPNRGGAVYNVGSDALNISNTRFESNTADVGDAIYHIASVDMNITSSCFTNNGDTAVFDTATTSVITANGGGNVLLSNWWGTSWGPRISGVASNTSSYVSNGDSINGNGATVVGNTLVDVGLTSNPTDQSQAPTGAWLTTAPFVAGATCQTCTAVSSLGHGRTCS